MAYGSERLRCTPVLYIYIYIHNNSHPVSLDYARYHLEVEYKLENLVHHQQHDVNIACLDGRIYCSNSSPKVFFSIYI